MRNPFSLRLFLRVNLHHLMPELIRFLVPEVRPVVDEDIQILEDLQEDQRRAGHNVDKAGGEVGRKVVREVAEGKG